MKTTCGIHHLENDTLSIAPHMPTHDVDARLCQCGVTTKRAKFLRTKEGIIAAFTAERHSRKTCNVDNNLQSVSYTSYTSYTVLSEENCLCIG